MAMLLKIDMEKVFDRISWTFLKQVLIGLSAYLDRLGDQPNFGTLLCSSMAHFLGGGGRYKARLPSFTRTVHHLLGSTL